MNKFLSFVILIILVIGGGYYFLNHQIKSKPITLPQGSVCDSETMVCEDGTVLNKQGPNCDFPPCPLMNASNSASPEEGKEIAVTGTLVCLPHKNTNGPQTLECAYGLKADDGNNYGLSDPTWKYLMGIGMDNKVRVTGKLTKPKDSKYDTEGTIEIENLEKI